MQCLQDNLERLSPLCKQQVSNYTEEEAEHLELNPFITAYCSRFLETHCQVSVGKCLGLWCYSTGYIFIVV